MSAVKGDAEVLVADQPDLPNARGARREQAFEELSDQLATQQIECRRRVRGAAAASSFGGSQQYSAPYVAVLTEACRSARESHHPLACMARRLARLGAVVKESSVHRAHPPAAPHNSLIVPIDANAADASNGMKTTFWASPAMPVRDSR